MANKNFKETVRSIFNRDLSAREERQLIISTQESIKRAARYGKTDVRISTESYSNKEIRFIINYFENEGFEVGYSYIYSIIKIGGWAE